MVTTTVQVCSALQQYRITISRWIFWMIFISYLGHWADDKQSKARNLDGKYRQMALVGFDT